MFLRFCVVVLLPSTVITGVFGASVAVDLVHSLPKFDTHATLSDYSTKSLNVSDSSAALKFQDVDLQLNDQRFNLSVVALTVINGTNLDNSTYKAGNRSGSNFTVLASLPPSITARNVDVQLKSLEANVSDDDYCQLPTLP